MDHNKDFTISKRFRGLKQYVKKLKKQGRHYVMMVDPAIMIAGPASNVTYEPFSTGVSARYDPPFY